MVRWQLSKSNLVYSYEIFDLSFIEDLMTLIDGHYEEVSILHDYPLEVRWDLYLQAMEQGRLHTYTVRFDGDLVGYALYLVDYHPHYASLKLAVPDVIYLRPDHRKGMAGKRLIQLSEAGLKAAGVDVVQGHTKQKRDLSVLFKRLGYEHSDTIMIKRL